VEPAKFEENIHKIMDSRFPGLEESIVSEQKLLEGKISDIENRLLSAGSSEEANTYRKELERLWECYKLVLAGRRKNRIFWGGRCGIAILHLFITVMTGNIPLKN
jgi:hypothetical protein